MDKLYLLFATILLMTILAGLWRIVKGPTPADRMIVAQLFGTTGVAMILLLVKGMNKPSLLIIALVFALLVLINLLGFLHCFWREENPGD